MKVSARLLTAAHNYPSATALWRRVRQLGTTLSPEERRDYATAALATGDAVSAQNQLAISHKTGNDNPADWMVEAQLGDNVSTSPRLQT